MPPLDLPATLTEPLALIEAELSLAHLTPPRERRALMLRRAAHLAAIDSWLATHRPSLYPRWLAGRVRAGGAA